MRNREEVVDEIRQAREETAARDVAKSKLNRDFLNRIPRNSLIDSSPWSLDKIRAFGEVIREAQVTSINLFYNNLFPWSVEQIHAFGEVIRGSQVTSIVFSLNNFRPWSVEQIRVLGKAIRRSQVTSIDLSSTALGDCSVEQIRAFGEAIQGSQVTSINLSSNMLDNWTVEQIRAFGEVIRGSQVTSINLSINSFGYWKVEQIRAFGEAIRESQVTSINLACNNLSCWKGRKIRAFGEAIRESQVTSINLAYNNLSYWKVGKIRVFGEAIRGSQVTSINLAYNNLAYWKGRKIRAFGELAGEISFSYDELGKLKPKVFNRLIKGLRGTKVNLITPSLPSSQAPTRESVYQVGSRRFDRLNAEIQTRLPRTHLKTEEENVSTASLDRGREHLKEQHPTKALAKLTPSRGRQPFPHTIRMEEQRSQVKLTEEQLEQMVDAAEKKLTDLQEEQQVKQSITTNSGTTIFPGRKGGASF